MNFDKLKYLSVSPESGRYITIAPGVHWVRLPVPDGLDHINVWVLDDGACCTLIDTGTWSANTVSAWEKLLADKLLARKLTRVIITHMHSDHIGMAGWIAERFNPEIWMSRLEYLSCHAHKSSWSREISLDELRFYAEAGWSQTALDKYSVNFHHFGDLIYSLPDSYHRLQDGQAIRIGESTWKVVVGNGHSPEHCCLYNEEINLLIAGDQILPKITSNISVNHMEPEANPLLDWLNSLDKLQSLIPDNVLVLPAHGECFHGLHLRIEQLRDECHRALSNLRRILRAPHRAVDIFNILFSREITERNVLQLYMATGEAVAYLNYLVHCGDARKDIENGVIWYRCS